MNISPKHLVESQIPQYIRENNPLLTKFMQYYYEFVENSRIQEIIQEIKKFNDIDQVDEEFLENFFEEFRTLPKSIAADKRLVAKFIYDLYKSKGTAQSTQLLFKILYGEDVSIRYPSDNILRASVGKWVEDTVLTVTLSSGDIKPTTNKIRLTDVYGQHDFEIEFFEEYASEQYRVLTHLLRSFIISDVNNIEFYTDNTLDAIGYLTNTPAGVTVVNGGSNWKVGQLIIFPSTKKSTIAQIKQVDENGAIVKTSIVQYGFGDLTDAYVVSPYDVQTDPIFTKPPELTTQEWNDTKATLLLSFDLHPNSAGYFEALDGMLSVPDIRLEDNFYYQIFSYVIETNHLISEFKESLKLIHPAGVKYFAEMKKETGIPVSYGVNRLMV